jgi:hypothetical protein
MRKKGYRFLKKDEKIAKKYDFWEQKNAPKARKSRFLTKNFKKMDKMMSWGMSAQFLMMPVTLQGIKNMGQQNTLF